MEEEGGAKKKNFDPLTLARTPSPNVDGWCIKGMLKSCEFFSFLKVAIHYFPCKS